MLLNSLVFSLLVVLGMGCSDGGEEKGPLDSGDGAADIVAFADAGLEAAVREALGKPAGTLIEEELLALTHLDGSGRQVADLTGIEQLKNLAVLDLSDNRIRDIAALSAMARLCTLDLAGNQVEDVEPLAELTQLQHLVLGQIDGTVHFIRPDGSQMSKSLVNSGTHSSSYRSINAPMTSISEASGWVSSSPISSIN